MSFISWIIVGAIAGWLASIMSGDNAKMGAVANIVVGIIGAFVGGFVLRFVGGSGVTGLNLRSIMVATFGAFIFLFILNKLRK